MEIGREELTTEHTGTTIGGALLIAGTCMGAGMLALPIATGASGFFPAMFVNLVCWLFMLSTGLLFLEATLWMPDGANVISMSERFLGRAGKWLGGGFFLFLYYCLMVAYIAGGAPTVVESVRQLTGYQMGIGLGFVVFPLVLASILLVGAWFVDRINWILMSGLIISYFLLIGIGAQDVDPAFLLKKNWKLSLFAMPILFSAYGYHNIIPSISTYLRRSRSHLRLAIILGTTLPFVVFSIWQWLIIGSVPLENLEDAASQGVHASRLLSQVTGIPWVGHIVLFFGFFALTTSILGVSLSMIDFLGDGFKMGRKGFQRLALTLLVFVPPSILAFNYPGIFIEALGVAGGFGEAFLNGLLPIALVWVGRYHMKLEGRPLLFGGRSLLALLFVFTLFIMALEAIHLFG